MQRTINSNIGGRIFHVEEEAYAALDSYLRDVKNHFSSYEDRDEIMTDIENRIAEQFESLGRGDRAAIITKPDVDTVIATMGKPQDFSDEPAAGPDKTEQASNGPRKRSRLYRNTDDQIIAGVASGIAAYFTIDPLWVRLIFGLSILFGGFGILLYIILWIIVPAAETTAEKLEMHGNAVTLSSIEQSMRDNLGDTEKAKRGFKKAGEGVRKTGTALGRAIQFIAKLIIRLIGISITIGFFVASAVIVFTAMVLLTNGNSSYIDFPLRDLLSGVELYTIIFAGFFTALIPLVIMGLIGVSMASFRNAFNKPITIAAIVIWFIALFTLLSFGLRAAPRYDEFRKNHPAFKTEVRVIDAKNFTKVSFSNDMRVEIKQGSEFKVEVTAVQRDQDRIAANVENGTLSVQKNYEGFGICIFCFHDRARVVVTMPTVEAIEGANAVSITAEHIIADRLELEMKNGSRLEIKTTANAVRAETSNGSRITISGTATDTEFQAENGSRIVGYNLESLNVVAEAANGSRVQVKAIASLRAVSENGSHITYLGTPKQIEGDAKPETDIEAEPYRID